MDLKAFEASWSLTYGVASGVVSGKPSDDLTIGNTRKQFCSSEYIKSLEDCERFLNFYEKATRQKVVYAAAIAPDGQQVEIRSLNGFDKFALAKSQDGSETTLYGHFSMPPGCKKVVIDGGDRA